VNSFVTHVVVLYTLIAALFAVALG